MIRSLWAIALGLSLLLAVTGEFVRNTIRAGQPPRAEQWKKVEEAGANGLPKTAISLLDPIIAGAIKDKAYPEAIKAITRKLRLEDELEDERDHGAKRINALRATIAATPAEMHPVLNAILAHAYWQYSWADRWEPSSRTPTSTAPGTDVRTWDTSRLVSEAEKTFALALTDEKWLKATPIEKYHFLLDEAGTVPDAYRPTLFDFLAFEALNFYTSTEPRGAKPTDAFELSADSPVFGTRAEFLKWEPKAADIGDRTVKAIKLYQQVLAFHQDDKDKSALLDADLHRLRYGWNKAVGENKATHYKAALEAFVTANAGHDLSVMARYQLAITLEAERDLVKAREIALAGARAHPDSAASAWCLNLVREIESKSATIATERVWADPLPAIKVTYKNVTKAYFRVVSGDFAEWLKTAWWRPDHLTHVEARALLDKKPVQEFSRDLPATTDYQERTEIVPAPVGLKPGLYYLIVSHTADFGQADNSVSYTDFRVSNLAVVCRQQSHKAEVTGLVTDNRTGEPVEGAKVHLWSGRYKNGASEGGWKEAGTVFTDKDGRYCFAADATLSHFVRVTHGDQQLVSARAQATGWDRDEPSDERVVFFTDRSLYRPGQPIHYKGITFRFDHGANTYETVAGRDFEIVFTDANGEEVARHKVRTSAHGSFSGTFTAPRDRLTGEMGIRAVPAGERSVGSARVTVEEYKRPRFKVEVEAPTEAGRPNDVIRVPGRATQYNGVPVAGARVTFRVTRDVRYPDWFNVYSWWLPEAAAPAQEIAHGVVTTDASGGFTIPFVAKPDPTASPKDEPAFRYTVTAHVTDTAGETRTGTRSVTVASAALRAELRSDEWLTAEEESVLTIHATTLNGVGQRAKGAVRIHALAQPAKVARARIDSSPPSRADNDLSNPQRWALGDEVFSCTFETDDTGRADLKRKLAPGIYRAVLETTDAFGGKVTARHQFTVLKPTADKFHVKVPNVVVAPKWTVEVGETFTLLWGTGYDTGRAYIEVECRGKILQAFWTPKDATQHVLTVPVKEEMRGGFTVHVTQVRENRAYLTSKRVEVPWSNKNLTVKWERFVNKLEPGAKETFTAVVTGPDAKRAVAEMVATMYDASLEAQLPHDWIRSLDVFRRDDSKLSLSFENSAMPFSHLHGVWPSWDANTTLTYRGFSVDITKNWRPSEYFGQDGTPDDIGSDGRFQRAAPVFGFGGGIFGGFGGGGFGGGGFGGGNLGFGGGIAGFGGAQPGFGDDIPQGRAGQRPVGSPNLGNISARKNLNETAFFYPHLTSGEDGTVRISFEMPQALTRWKFMGFAHDKTLRSGFLTDTVVTAKDLMAQPNPPRFLREGDVVEFTVKVSNASTAPQKGTARLSFRDARTDKSVDAQLGLVNADQPFDLAAGESKTLAWKITVPDDLGPIVYKAVAATDRLSDGEEAVIPVLSRRVLVTESLPLPIRGPGTKDFDFAKLRKSGASDTLRHQSLTVQMVSRPSWYAVMALPYLMEYPHECSEQTFNRLYANALARHIATSDPNIRRVFDQWKGTPALDSPLEKNADLKSVVLEETPWVREAQAESQARRNLGLLFDAGRMDGEIERVTAKLATRQHQNGSWSWFPGGRGDDYITLYITTGYGRLRHLGVRIDADPAVKALDYLDAWTKRLYELAQKHKPEENHLTPTVALYLYGRSFFLADKGIAAESRDAIDYWLAQSKKFWTQLGSRQSQAHLALALKRFGDKETPAAIMKSLKERSRTEEELGMYWPDTSQAYSWVHAPIETQALLIEAFDEVANDEKAVEDCKVWLLKQKQTQSWHTTKATADAVYALLLRGDKLLSSDALVEVTLGNQTIKPEKVEAGTGFYEQKFLKTGVQPSMGTIRVQKPDKGVSWGSVHWSYLEDVSKVTPHDATPLKLEKKLFKKTFTKAGPVIEPVKAGEALAVGDEVTVRIVLRTDRDLEYCHLKDHRGSGTEPVNVLSRYKYQDGLGYYEATKDTASHFFIDYLPKGTYVFEYPVRVQLRGKYPTGFASIECMYAPEFNSHSENINLEVK